MIIIVVIVVVITCMFSGETVLSLVLAESLEAFGVDQQPGPL